MSRQRGNLENAGVLDFAPGEHQKPRVFDAGVLRQLLERPAVSFDSARDRFENVDLFHPRTVAQYFARRKPVGRMILQGLRATIAGMDTRGAVAANLAALLEFYGWDGKQLAAKARWPRGKKKGTRVSARAVQYLLAVGSDKPSPAIDLVEAVAIACKVPAWLLLAPGLDPKDPPTLITRKALDAEVERRVAILWEDIKAQMEALRVHEIPPDGPSVANPFAHIPLAEAAERPADPRRRAEGKKTPHKGKA
jgi:hypothetical protein